MTVRVAIGAFRDEQFIGNYRRTALWRFECEGAAVDFRSGSWLFAGSECLKIAAYARGLDHGVDEAPFPGAGRDEVAVILGGELGGKGWVFKRQELVFPGVLR